MIERNPSWTYTMRRVSLSLQTLVVKEEYTMYENVVDGNGHANAGKIHRMRMAIRSWNPVQDALASNDGTRITE
jgi:hypothetical protein